MIRLIADSASDRPVLAGAQVDYVPLTVSTEERSFPDTQELDIPHMLDYLAEHKGRSYTSCPNVEDWITHFGGEEEIFAVTITSGLSGSYNAAMAAKQLYTQSHPHAKIAVLDSLSTGPEMRLILEKLKELREQQLSFEAIETRIREYQQKTRLFFCLQSIHNLSQNGRVSKVAAAAVGMLGIRIVGTASPEGTLSQLAKCRGDRKALPELIELLKNAGYAGGKLRITHVENLPLAESFLQQVQRVWPQANALIAKSSGLCSYYAERGAILVGAETVF